MKLKYKILMAIIAVAIGLCLMIYQSYALWVVTLSGQENIVEVGCFNIEFIENTSSIALSNSYPVSDEKGMSGEAYSFTITNKCTVDSAYQVTLNTLNANTMGDDKVKYVIYKDSESKPSTGSLITSAPINADKANITVTDLKESYIIASGELKGAEEENGTGESHTYNVYLWIDESAGNEVENTRFEASINIVNASTRILEGYEKCIADYGAENPQCQIMANVDTTGACPTVNDDETVEVTAIEDTESLVCTAPDDYGTSYYYRGNVDNNYVKFAGYYWRILRINGDGSIRMIYAGDASVIDALDNKEEVLKNGYNDSSTDYTQIGVSAYNSSSNDNAYVGYMYGTPGSNTYEETHANINASTIKTVLDTWYQTNLEKYSNYIDAKEGFCNDRKPVTGAYSSSSYGTLAYGTNPTTYAPFGRLYANDTWKINQTPTLKCSQTNDYFTVNRNGQGNGTLTYPIGLITADEAVLAGGFGAQNNTNYYLYTGQMYWTMSPSGFNETYSTARLVQVYPPGRLVVNYSYLLSGVRPVINLRADVTLSGTGTSTDPYIVEGAA